MGSNMFTFDVREIGSSHIANHKPCQDYSLSYSTDTYCIAIVADGHGSDKCFRSDIGSQQAAEITKKVLCAFAKDTKDFTILPNNDWQRQIASSIITLWRQSIEKDKESNPFTDKEWRKIGADSWQSVYGTTLLAVVRTPACFFALHIGDGKCVTIDKDGVMSQPIPWDERCFLNQTTSLCMDSALYAFRFVYMTENLPQSIFIGSDGVDDTYTNNDLLYAFYQKVDAMIRTNKEEGIAQLKEFLPQMTLRGSHDDISIAGIICHD